MSGFLATQRNPTDEIFRNIELGHRYGGGELRGAPTPRIDELAQEGLRLTQFLVEPVYTISTGSNIGASVCS